MSMNNWVFYSDDTITCTGCLKDYQADDLLTPCSHCGLDKVKEPKDEPTDSR